MRLNFGKCAYTIVRRICRDLGRHHRSKRAGHRRGCCWYCQSCNNFNAATAASFNRPRVAITGTRYNTQPNSVAGTPLRIPYGNKDVAMKLGARYGSAGWYAPPGVDLSAFGERGWLTEAPPESSDCPPSA